MSAADAAARAAYLTRQAAAVRSIELGVGRLLALPYAVAPSGWSGPSAERAREDERVLHALLRRAELDTQEARDATRIALAEVAA